MERRLTLSRKPDQSVTLFVAGERVEVTCRRMDVLTFTAPETVRIVRTELLDREAKQERAA